MVNLSERESRERERAVIIIVALPLLRLSKRLQLGKGCPIISNNPFDHILKVSVPYLHFLLSYIYILFNWVAMVIIGNGNLGKFGLGEGRSHKQPQDIPMIIY